MSDPQLHPPWVALRYMTRFRCIGGDCEDNCCTYSWAVTVNQDDYVRLEAALSGTSDDRARFARGCLRTDAADAPSYAALAKTPDGRCLFLDAEGLCSVHRAAGEAALPGVCATYPRNVTVTSDGGELTGTLSCPEAARLCLFADDAVAVVPCEAGPWAARAFRTTPAGDDPYLAHFSRVRGAVLELLTTPGYPFASRCYFAAALADRLGGFLHRGATAFDPARLTRELADALAPNRLISLHRDFHAAAPSPTLALALVNQILIAAMQACDAPKFLALLDGIYAPYLLGDSTISGRDVWAGYEARRRLWEGRFPGRIDRALTNYAVNSCMRSPYTDAPTLLAHLLLLFVLVDVWRFLCFCHPALDQAPPPPPADDSTGLLDRVLVESCYLLSRAIDHSREFRRQIGQVLAENGVTTLPHAALLLAM